MVAPRWCGASPEFWEKAKRELALGDEALRVRFGDDFQALVFMELRVFMVQSIAGIADDVDEHLIEIQVELLKKRLTIQITDDGIAFNPFEQEEPDTDQPLQERQVGGLGIHLVRKLMDEVHYERRADKNVVRLTKGL